MQEVEDDLRVAAAELRAEGPYVPFTQTPNLISAGINASLVDDPNWKVFMTLPSQ